MTITHKLTMDIQNRGVAPCIDAVQNEGCTRAVQVALTAGGKAWTVPAGVTAAVAFSKPDGTSGLYDTLPNAAAAITLSGSTVTAVLAPEVLTCAGQVAANIVFMEPGTLKRLASFAFFIHVERDPAAGKVKSNSYYRYQTLSAVNYALEEMSARLEDGMLFKGLLTELQDLDTLTQTGFYIFETDSVPANTAFPNKSLVEVKTVSNGGYTAVTQVQRRLGLNTDAYIATRHRTTGGVWSPWYYPVLTGSRTVTDTAMAYRRILTAEEDLDAVTENGIYIFTDGNLPANAPFSYGGILEVFGSAADNTQKCQRFVGYGSERSRGEAHREMGGGKWFSWRYCLDNSQPAACNTALAYAGVLTSENDLDAVTDNGIYIFVNTAMPANAPFPYGGILTVSGSAADNTQKSQHFVGYGSEGSRGEARRELSSDGWHSWRYLPWSANATGYEAFSQGLSILGDSISTFKGFVPEGEGYAYYYDGSGEGISSVEQTWWKRLLEETGMVLRRNNSVSGSCVCSGLRTDRIAASDPRRTGGLSDDEGNAPDHIIVYMGTNDYLSANAAEGSFDGTGEFPTATDTFREAYAVMLADIQKNYPMARLYCCTLPYSGTKTANLRQIDYNGNGVTKARWNKAIRELAALFGAQVIELESCGINARNLPFFTGDDNSNEDGVDGEGNLGRGLHPNAAGMERIYRQVLKYFPREVRV